MAWRKDVLKTPRNLGRGGLLSKAYRKILNEPVSEDLKDSMGLVDGDTYADAIAFHIVGTALGKIPDDQISFRAITELRETTEGKTPEKAIIASNVNPELANLAQQVAIGAAMARGEKPGGESEAEDEDRETQDSEAAFHEAVDNGS